jgi:hypothetical protein
VRRALRRLRPRPAAPPPAWAGPALREVWSEGDDESPVECRSHAQQRIWDGLVDPRTAWGHDALALEAERAGQRILRPWLDARLARFVLAIPPRHLLARGRGKRLVRDALADALPPLVRDRNRYTVAASFMNACARECLPLMREPFDAGEWASAPFVDRGGALLLWERLARAPAAAAWLDWYALWSVGRLESWLRRLGSAS